jgi:D-xylose reductase
VQRGTAIIPKTTKKARLAENIALFDFQLSFEEMQTLSALNRNHRYNDPGAFCEGMGLFFPIYD